MQISPKKPKSTCFDLFDPIPGSIFGLRSLISRQKKTGSLIIFLKWVH